MIVCHIPAWIPLVYIILIWIWYGTTCHSVPYNLNSHLMYHKPHGAPLTPSGWECMSAILLRSNAYNFCNRFHKVDSKVARAISKIIRVLLFARLKEILRRGVNCGMATACPVLGMHIHNALRRWILVHSTPSQKTKIVLNQPYRDFIRVCKDFPIF